MDYYTDSGGKVAQAIVLIDPATGAPYKANFVNQISQGSVDTTLLAKEAKQDSEISAINGVTSKLGTTLNVAVTNPSTALPTGASTAANQTSEISKLNDIYQQLGAGINTTIQNSSLPVTVASLPLPAGAATAAKQDAIVSAINATQNVNVVNSSAIPVSLPSGAQPVSGTVAVSSVASAVPVTDNNGSLTVDGTVAISNTSFPVTGTVGVSSISAPVAVTDNNGSLTVDGNVGISGTVQTNVTNSSLAITAASLPLPASASTDAKQDTGNASLASIDIKTPSLGQTAAAYSVPVVIAPDQTGIKTNTTQLNGNTISLGNGAATGTGVQRVAIASDNTPFTVNNVPAPPGVSGASLSSYQNAALLATPTLVKGSQTRLLRWRLYNPNTSVIFVQAFSSATAGAVTLGTTTAIETFPVPPSTLVDGYAEISYPYTAGLVIAATTTATGSTAPAAGVFVNLGYV